MCPTPCSGGSLFHTFRLYLTPPHHTTHTTHVGLLRRPFDVLRYHVTVLATFYTPFTVTRSCCAPFAPFPTLAHGLFPHYLPAALPATTHPRCRYFPLPGSSQFADATAVLLTHPPPGLRHGSAAVLPPDVTYAGFCALPFTIPPPPPPPDGWSRCLCPSPHWPCADGGRDCLAAAALLMPPPHTPPAATSCRW